MKNCGNVKANQTNYPFILPELPFGASELEPYMSANTFAFHHCKHHLAYVNNLNKLLETSDLAGKSLEEIILAAAGNKDLVGIFNNAAQVWNHSFFWHCMKQNGGGKPTGNLLVQIEKDFGSFDDFCNAFKQAGATQFGSGWAWLAWDGSKLLIEKTANAELPMTRGMVAILTCDVWEHAYYLDYQNMRPDYLAVFLKNLVNWEFAQQNFSVCS